MLFGIFENRDAHWHSEPHDDGGGCGASPSLILSASDESELGAALADSSAAGAAAAAVAAVFGAGVDGAEAPLEADDAGAGAGAAGATWARAAGAGVWRAALPCADINIWSNCAWLISPLPAAAAAPAAADGAPFVRMSTT